MTEMEVAPEDCTIEKSRGRLAGMAICTLLVGSVGLIGSLINVTPAHAATFQYLRSSSHWIPNYWAKTTSRPSYRNQVLSEITGVEVKAHNGTFTSTGVTATTQSYARSTRVAQCMWTKPVAWGKVPLICTISF